MNPTGWLEVMRSFGDDWVMAACTSCRSTAVLDRGSNSR